MKLFKKIISSICALTMLSSVVAVVTANAAVESPTISAALASYNEEDGTGTIDISIEGMATVDAPYVQLFNFGIDVYLDGDFDTSLYATTPPFAPPIKTNVISNVGDLTMNMLTSEDGVNYIRAAYNSDAGVMADQKLYSIKFKVNDTTVDNKVIIKDAGIAFRTYDESYEVISSMVKYGQAGTSASKENELAYAGDVIVTEGGDDIVITIPGTGDGTFTATGDEADVMPDQRAAAAIAEIPAVGEDDTYNAVKWTITVDGSQYDKTFGLANLDTSADMKMGLIVEYSTNDAETVTIDKAEYATVTE